MAHLEAWPKTRCVQCGETFSPGRSARLVCGVCWPVDAANPIDWAAVTVRSSRVPESERNAETGAGRSHEVA
jgi:hypothetical protein